MGFSDPISDNTDLENDSSQEGMSSSEQFLIPIHFEEPFCVKSGANLLFRNAGKSNLFLQSFHCYVLGA